METMKLSTSINNLKEYGDAVKIVGIVNKQRVARGEKKISPAYVRMMLNGARTMTEEVKVVSDTYFQLKEKSDKELKQAFAN